MEVVLDPICGHHILINGHPTSGLAIHRWGRDTFLDQIRFLKPNFFSDAPRNVLTGVSAPKDFFFTPKVKVTHSKRVR